MGKVLAGFAVEDDDAAIAVAVRDERLVGFGIDPDARWPAKQHRVVAAAGLVVGPDGHQVLAVPRELLHPMMHVGADPDVVLVIDEDAVWVA